jgi:small subunit ribosomal protein S6
MPLYESVFIARQDISTSQVEALTETFAGIIGENGGAVHKKEYWGLRGLTYRIRKNRKGHYVLMNIDAPSAAVLEMERVMKINEDVIRVMTVKVDALEEGPSAILTSREGREGREGRGDREGREGRGDREGRGPRRSYDNDQGEE